MRGSKTIQKLKSVLVVYKLIWYISLGLGVFGAFTAGITNHSAGWVFFIFPMVILISFSLINSWQVMQRGVAQPAGGQFTILAGPTVFFLALILSSEIIPAQVQIPFIGKLTILVTGTQALFLSISLQGEEAPLFRRNIIPAASHLLIGLGSILLVVAALRITVTRVFQGVVLWYATGLTVLLLNTFWRNQRIDSSRFKSSSGISDDWNNILLISVVIGIISAIFIVFSSLNQPLTLEIVALARPWAFDTTLEQFAVIVVGTCAVLAFATLSAPTSAPSPVQRLNRIAITISSQALTTAILLNTLLLGLFFVVPPLLTLIFGLLIVLVTLTVILDYLRAVYISRNQTGNTPTEPVSACISSSITVVIPAYNEAGVLSETIERNIKALNRLQFLLVPAAGSTDETVEIAHQFQANYPDRIRVFEGTTGSKAGDLNRAWNRIDTPFVLLLDADEVTDMVFVSRALRTLKESPDVGIVQARKVPRQLDNWMARFVAAERRVQTWISHQFIHDVCAASHFAGSGAVLRHKVPNEIDGWSPQALTEDIDFTIRLYLQTDWQISYNSRLAVYTLPPATISNLIRQRRRWTRGWVEVTWRYTRNLIHSRQTLGWRKTAGLLWELFSTISAPLYLVSIAITIFIFGELGQSFPLLFVVSLAVFLLPARGIIFSYTAKNDIIKSVDGIQIVAVFFFAYLWMLFIWLIQLHVLYLQISGTPKKWEVTQKQIYENNSAHNLWSD
ncbi:MULTISPECIES: glycosyltransferase [Halomicrobium]|uniref:Glycosyl transferase family 2 n=2 Tax=Halomicrobium mukohataei TaxID=57705 RepID=C7P3U9_HALMD|nr:MULTISPECIES: glycosyltransferase family 2 protein [Halomicrobium]ACV47771.1 glycosyl transferase family 2 [Halomicrobium mukohataei DSM 12286]QCD66222.1 glycosyltransferase family 2 protein [Halomicrobium mukohataei]QFR21027.1 glycosyltransferase [Halomicrobium sp. ZPS1]